MALDRALELHRPVVRNVQEHQGPRDSTCRLQCRRRRILVESIGRTPANSAAHWTTKIGALEHAKDKLKLNGRIMDGPLGEAPISLHGWSTRRLPRTPRCLTEISSSTTSGVSASGITLVTITNTTWTSSTSSKGRRMSCIGKSLFCRFSLWLFFYVAPK